MNLPQLLAKITSKDQSGYLTNEDIAALAGMDRLRQLLIRCGACRMIVAAQDAQHIAEIIDTSGSDYVRDISLLAGDPAYHKPAPPKPAAPRPRYIQPEYETDASGCCYSDADPGL